MRPHTTGTRLLAAAVALFGAAGWAAAFEPSFLTPERGESIAPGSLITVEWHIACDSAVEPSLAEAELVLSLDGGLSYPIRVSRELDPCESTVSWRVPALATDHARLALRVGNEMDGDSEEIAVVSAPFRILPDAERREQPMLRRANEWWTDPETEILDSGDLLGRSMRSTGQRLTSALELGAVALPAPASALRRELRGSGLAVSTLSGRRPSASLPPAPAGAPTPLRL